MRTPWQNPARSQAAKGSNPQLYVAPKWRQHSVHACLHSPPFLMTLPGNIATVLHAEVQSPLDFLAAVASPDSSRASWQPD